VLGRWIDRAEVGEVPGNFGIRRMRAAKRERDYSTKILSFSLAFDEHKWLGDLSMETYVVIGIYLFGNVGISGGNPLTPIGVLHPVF